MSTHWPNNSHYGSSNPTIGNHVLSGVARRLKMRAGPTGLHLFDRDSGWNVLFDEVRTNPEQWCHAPRHISVALTNACDLHCIHCYAPKHRAVLDDLRLMVWLTELDRNGCLGVGFGGGEPTLHPQFAVLCQRVAEESGLAVSMTTHGHHLHESLLRALRGSVHFVRVSMDGMERTYERIRGRPFRDLLGRLEMLRDALPFGINYVVTEETLPELDAAAELGEKLGARQFLLLPQRATTRVPGVHESTRKLLAGWISKYSGHMTLAISEGDAEGIPTCDPFAGEDGLRSYAHINSEGVLKKSSFDVLGVCIDERGVMPALKALSDPTVETQL